jgi:ArsR family transcriptional regulator, arsenate/arsenite/antimonite-responsive transcriptional repressor
MGELTLAPSVTPIACCAPIAASTLSDVEAEATATLFRALGDPARVRILNMLAGCDEGCVCELTEPLGLSQPTVSHHLKTLTEAGVLSREQRGRLAFYSITDEARVRLTGLADLTKGGCCT